MCMYLIMSFYFFYVYTCLLIKACVNFAFNFFLLIFVLIHFNLPINCTIFEKILKLKYLPHTSAVDGRPTARFVERLNVSKRTSSHLM